MDNYVSVRLSDVRGCQSGKGVGTLLLLQLSGHFIFQTYEKDGKFYITLKNIHKNGISVNIVEDVEYATHEMRNSDCCMVENEIMKVLQFVDEPGITKDATTIANEMKKREQNLQKPNQGMFNQPQIQLSQPYLNHQPSQQSSQQPSQPSIFSQQSQPSIFSQQPSQQPSIFSQQPSQPSIFSQQPITTYRQY